MILKVEFRKEKIMKKPKVTQISTANQLKISEKIVKRNISKLKEKGIVERIGADKNGYWKIVNN